MWQHKNICSAKIYSVIIPWEALCQALKLYNGCWIDPASRIPQSSEGVRPINWQSSAMCWVQYGAEERPLKIPRKGELGQASWSRLAKEDKDGQGQVKRRVLGKRNVCVQNCTLVLADCSLAPYTGLAKRWCYMTALLSSFGLIIFLCL